MQVPNEKKRKKILDAAACCFANRPFHKVLLSEVAEKARVGKGTLYTYFQSKEDLYLAVLFDIFSHLVDRLSQRVDINADQPLENLLAVISELAGFAHSSPDLFELIRTAPDSKQEIHARWKGKRQELAGLIEGVLRQGIRMGVFSDPHPEWTARYIPAIVRSMFMDGPQELDKEELTQHILNFFLAWLQKGDSPQ